MREIFFTSDTHFFHENVIKHCDRPYNSWQEMNEDLILRWNDKIGPKDTVYHLGDFAYGPGSKDAHQVRELLSRLNGKIHLIVGNHDEQVRHVLKYSRWESVKWMDYITFDKQKIMLCHYPMKSWRDSHHGSWMLFGHCHGTLPDDGIGKSFDVGVDCHNYNPLSFGEVKKIMKHRPTFEARGR